MLVQSCPPARPATRLNEEVGQVPFASPRPYRHGRATRLSGGDGKDSSAKAWNPCESRVDKQYMGGMDKLCLSVISVC